jgi:hypothetical protein
MNTQEELQEAFADYHAGKLGVIPPDVMPPNRLMMKRGASSLH